MPSLAYFIAFLIGLVVLTTPSLADKREPVNPFKKLPPKHKPPVHKPPRLPPIVVRPPPFHKPAPPFLGHPTLVDVEEGNKKNDPKPQPQPQPPRPPKNRPPHKPSPPRMPKSKRPGRPKNRPPHKPPTAN